MPFNFYIVSADSRGGWWYLEVNARGIRKERVSRSLDLLRVWCVKSHLSGTLWDRSTLLISWYVGPTAVRWHVSVDIVHVWDVKWRSNRKERVINYWLEFLFVNGNYLLDKSREFRSRGMTTLASEMELRINSDDVFGLRHTGGE